MRNAECGVRILECGVRNEEGRGILECGMRILFQRWELYCKKKERTQMTQSAIRNG